MAKVFRRAVPRWFLLTLFFGVGLVGVGYFALNRPLPSYLIASSNLSAGQTVLISDFETAALELGEASKAYVTLENFEPGMQLIDSIPAGELLPKSRLTPQLDPNLTTLRVTPSLPVSLAVVPGSYVGVWQSFEIEGEITTLQLVERAKVTQVIAPDGLFANDTAEVELLLDVDSATLLMDAITAEYEIYLLGRP